MSTLYVTLSRAINELAAEEIRGWLDKRFPLASPA